MRSKSLAKATVVVGILSMAGALIWRTLHPRCIRPGCPENAVPHEVFCEFHSDPHNWKSSHVELIPTHVHTSRMTRPASVLQKQVLASQPSGRKPIATKKPPVVKKAIATKPTTSKATTASRATLKTPNKKTSTK